ncbi:probable inactive shikimate kinase like 1, chloroplastic isoform X2 [Durio zibethinus]|uniref:Probable inactive shikimate kinase like 1, chloroplastic isoform X2 n=1 Tax=Durio zibethinus TaxID=66656 RepID=A0A6P6BAU1_DURZI|nr:probable inactive shikimate kinase like 1, chloroplastic isoform X2 [Durio zibethinus]
MEMATIYHSSLTPLFHSKFLRSFLTTIQYRTSLPFPCLNVSRPPPRKSISTNRSFSDDPTSTTNAATVDPSIALKKKETDISADLRGTSIFLVGMNNSIKSSLGKLLADLLRYYYFDSDSLVSEAAGGESAAISLKESDEKGFREFETEVLKQLSSMGRLVVCAGDGAVQDSTNLALLRHGISIWINVPLDLVAKEIIENKSQLLSSQIAISGSYSEVFSQLTVLYKDTKIGYATADASISIQKVAYKLGYEDVDAVSTEDITMEVLKEIERLIKVKKMMEAAARPF